MSLHLTRASLFVLSQAKTKTTHILNQILPKNVGATYLGVAHLTSYGGNKAPRKKPWKNYKQKGFRYWNLPFDRVDSRLDDNSKIIVIDGNVATGKTELGQKIAKEFDLLYVPDVTDADMYNIVPELGVDLREFDLQLPVKARTCDFETFYSQSGSKGVLANFPRTQYHLFRHKLYRYAQTVIAHLLNTGQGVVMNRGMYSDMVFAYTLRKQGYLTAPAIKAYQTQFDYAVDYFWHPHLVIYLDAPVSMSRDRIKKRNVPWEVNSPVLTDEFLHAMGEVYKSRYLPYMKKHSEVLTYDLSDTPVPDFEVVVEDLESLNLDKAPDEYEDRFSEWNEVHNRDFNDMRSLCSPHNFHKLRKIWGFFPPYEAPELLLDGPEGLEQYRTLYKDPRIQYSPGFQPGQSVLLKM